MIKKHGALIIVLCLALGLTIPVHAAGITVKSSSVAASFPSSITFSITAQSSSPITDIRLHYSVVQIGFVDVSAEGRAIFAPSTTVSTSWKWDMVQSGGLPPGTVVHYWWTVKDSSGAVVTTPVAEVKFDDTRFTQKITGGYINLYWYEGTQSFAADLLKTAQDAVVNLEKDTGATLQRSVALYIYANATDLQSSMIFAQDWTGGVTFTQYGTIAIGISQTNLTWGKRAIAHELTHLVIHQITMNPYNGIPPWLDEGLAMYNEGPLETQFSLALSTAIQSNIVLSLQTLSSPFSADSNLAYLSYAESQSAVSYLIKTYGKDKMYQLLDTFRKGSTNDGALLKVYGINTRTLTTQWEQSIGATPKTAKMNTLPVFVKFGVR